jgi:D-alanyl-D-alanine carboxypeptidase/D-alanyl-D-alanine-endopeptidase (penicillin-binding protein 4)
MLRKRFYAALLSGALVWVGVLSLVSSLQAEERSLRMGEVALATAIAQQVAEAKHAKLAVLVYDTGTRQEVYSHSPDTPLKPASVLKVLPSLVALELLGPQYRFATRVYAERSGAPNVGRLFVQGSGDPGLTAETAWAMARAVRRKGIQAAQGLVVDDSLFEDHKPAQGPRAYQTGSSALSFNYNSYTFEVCPSEVGKPASVLVDPLELRIPLVGSILTGKSGGKGFTIDPLPGGGVEGAKPFRISGSVSSRGGCQTVYRSMSEPSEVFGASFLGMLRAVGVQIPDQVFKAATPRQLDLVYTQESAPLSQIIRDLNHFSNNFIAEQILFALGQTESATFSRFRGLQRLESYLKSLGFRDSEFVIRDASGLSHDNRLSARMVMALLMRGLENQAVAPEFEGSLAVGNRSGTLRRRPMDPNGVVLRGKTGTLDGVSSLAGYVVGQSGKKYAFVVLQNAVTSVDKAHRFEDALVATLARN